MTQLTVRPRKTRELHNHHFDSTIWNDFKFRDDDVVIATYAKSGTTWVQQIVSQLIFNGRAGLPVAEMSPWLDLRLLFRTAQLVLLRSGRGSRDRAGSEPTGWKAERRGDRLVILARAWAEPL